MTAMTEGVVHAPVVSDTIHARLNECAPGSSQYGSSQTSLVACASLLCDTDRNCIIILSRFFHETLFLSFYLCTCE